MNTPADAVVASVILDRIEDLERFRKIRNDEVAKLSAELASAKNKVAGADAEISVLRAFLAAQSAPSEVVR